MSLIHNIVTHIMKVAKSKSNQSLAPALIETYARLLVYMEIESLGIKGFICKNLVNNLYYLFYNLFNFFVQQHNFCQQYISKSSNYKTVTVEILQIFVFTLQITSVGYFTYAFGNVLLSVIVCIYIVRINLISNQSIIRLHHIQPHYRVQLLTHLHSLATNTHTSSAQLHLWYNFYQFKKLHFY